MGKVPERGERSPRRPGFGASPKRTLVEDRHENAADDENQEKSNQRADRADVWVVPEIRTNCYRRSGAAERSVGNFADRVSASRTRSGLIADVSITFWAVY